MLICFFSVRSPVSANAQECAPGKRNKKALPIPQAPPRLAALEIIERCVCVCVAPPALALPRPEARRAGSVPPALSEKKCLL